MVLEFNQVSSPKVNDTKSELQAATTTSALQATNQASGADHEPHKASTKPGKKSPQELHQLGIAAQDRLQGQVRDNRPFPNPRQSSDQRPNSANSRFGKEGNHQVQQARNGRDSFHHDNVERRNYDNFRSSRGNEQVIQRGPRFRG